MPLTVGSLFSGIGGLDLGLERAGMTVKWQSEIDPYASKVLAKHWPDVPNLGDVTKIKWEDVKRVDLICGGFPCQPWSVAGSRLGTADERWLWPEFRRAVRDLRPRYVLVENVPGILVGGMGHILGDLAELGYDCEWEGVPASAFGAPHIRYREFIVAHTDSFSVWETEVRIPGSPDPTVSWDDGPNGNVADTQRCRWDGLHERIKQGHLETNAGGGGKDGPRRPPTRDHGGRVPGQGEEGGGESGGHWTVEPDVGRVADGVPHRMDRLRTLGNAVVPQVAEFVGRRIVESCDA